MLSLSYFRFETKVFHLISDLKPETLNRFRYKTVIRFLDLKRKPSTGFEI